jgi:multiple sugar transport system permease protein
MAVVTKRQIVFERAGIFAFLVIFLFPVLWLIATAYKPARDIFSIPPKVFDFTPSLSHFSYILSFMDVGSLVGSSLIISIGSAILSLLLGVPAGYALARSRWRWAKGVAYFFLFIRMVPAVAALIPFYLFMRDVGLLGTWWAVIIMNTMFNCAFVTWMMFSYFRALPRDLEEAAMTDGCRPIGAFWKVAVPAARSGIIASTLFCVMFAWNDFLFASFLTDLDSKPVSVALLTAYGITDVSWGAMGALAHFATIPIVLMAFFLNRYFVQGATNGVQ